VKRVWDFGSNFPIVSRYCKATEPVFSDEDRPSCPRAGTVKKAAKTVINPNIDIYMFLMKFLPVYHGV
jgi:hypothetical protein